LAQEPIILRPAYLLCHRDDAPCITGVYVLLHRNTQGLRKND
jgi:hypothetical protein